METDQYNYNKSAPCARTGVKKGKRGEINWSPSLPQGLSDQACRELQAELIDEMGKSSPNKTFIASKMGLTFALRRQDVNASTNVPDLLTR